MYLVNGITSDAKQTQTIILPNGKQCSISLEFMPLQLGWFMDVTSGNFSVTKIRLVNSLNVMHQFCNLIPFGIGCRTTDGTEPLFQQDFVSGRAKLYILDASEVKQFKEYLSGQVSA